MGLRVALKNLRLFLLTKIFQIFDGGAEEKRRKGTDLFIEVDEATEINLSPFFVPFFLSPILGQVGSAHCTADTTPYVKTGLPTG